MRPFRLANGDDIFLSFATTFLDAVFIALEKLECAASTLYNDFLQITILLFMRQPSVSTHEYSFPLPLPPEY